jgi:hypothetical protein
MTRFGKTRNSNDLRRRSKGLREFIRVLIACEGSKTEPNYFRGLCRHLGLRGTTVEIAGEECESAPISVYRYAAERVAEDGGFDEIYCVFDRDRHPTFAAAISAIQQHPSGKFRAIASHPCFEYWVLLHFGYTRAPFVAAGSDSPGDAALKAVKVCWSVYAKGTQNAHKFLNEDGRTDIAITNAGRARTDAIATGEPNPSTDVDLLVLRLRKLAAEQLVGPAPSV